MDNRQELIPVIESKINNEAKMTCNARDLHAFLDVGRDFTTWIKNRITKYDFIDNVDYIIVFPKTGENPLGGRPETDYHLTLDMAKELAMVENNDRGREARRYFIECEKRLKNRPTLETEDQLIDRALVIATNRLKTAEEERAKLKAKITADAPKVAFADAHLDCRQSMEVGAVAVLFQKNGINIGRNHLFAYLRDKGWLIKQNGPKGPRWNLPTQKGLDSGYFIEVIQPLFDGHGHALLWPNGKQKIQYVTHVTPAGVQWLYNHFNKTQDKQRLFDLPIEYMWQA
jgi:phage anti-repressor protein/phage antirepressor YoqD-like protein